jgi:hypothetical protein
MRASTSLLYAFALLGVAPAALAEEPTAPPEEPSGGESQAPLGSRQSFYQLLVGVRSSYITDAGYDPFSKDNSLVQSSFGLSRTLLVVDRFSFAPGVYWDYGKQDATARGDPSSIRVHRLGLGLEGRCQVFPWLYGFVRLTPGALQEKVSIEEPMAPGPLEQQHWLFSLDASGGAAVLLGPHAAEASFPLRFWAIAEGGYGWAPSKSLNLTPELPADETRPVGSLPLGKLALRGGFFRISAAVTY